MGESTDPNESNHPEVPPAGGGLSRRTLFGLGAAAGGIVLGAKMLNPTVGEAATTASSVPPDGDSSSNPDLTSSVLFGYTGEGPNGAEYDRVRLLTGKMPAGAQIAAGGGVGSTLVTLVTSPAGLQPNQPILFTGGAGKNEFETVYTASSYVAGSNPVQLASPIQLPGHTWTTFDTYSPSGPRAQDFTAFGVLPVACAIAEGVNGRYTLMLGALNDQGPPVNTVMVSPSLVSGPAAQMDRQRSLGSVGDGLGVALASPPPSTPLFQQGTNAPATVTLAAVPGQRHRLTLLTASYSLAPSGGSVTVQDGSATILHIDITASGALQVALPPGGIAGSVGKAMTITLSAGGGAVVGSLSVAKLTT